MAVIAQHLARDPSPPRYKIPDISPGLESLILSLLAKNPEEQPWRARRWPRRVAWRSSGNGGGAVPDPPPPSRRRAHHRRQRSATGSRSIRPHRASPLRRSRPRPAKPSLVGLTEALTPLRPVSNAGIVAVDGIDRRGSRARSGSSGRDAPAGEAARSLSSAVRESDPGRNAGTALAGRRRDARTGPRRTDHSDSRRDLPVGAYLAYLLGGSRRRGLLLQRTARPAQRRPHRLMLAMTWLMKVAERGDDRLRTRISRRRARRPPGASIRSSS